MQLGALATYAPTPPGRTKTLARVVVCQIGGGSRVGAPSKSVCLGKPRIGPRRWRMGPRRRNARAAQSARTLLSRRGARWWRTRPRGGRRRWYAIAATTCPDTREKSMDRRSLCQRGDGGYINNASVNREGMVQTSSVSSVSDAGSWPRSISWTRSCVSPSSCIASGFSTSSSSSWRWLGDRRILPPPSSSLSE